MKRCLLLVSLLMGLTLSIFNTQCVAQEVKWKDVWNKTKEPLVKMWNDKEVLFPIHYSGFVGSYHGDQFYMGANYAYVPSKLGFYGSFIYGLDGDYYANVGPVFRLTESLDTKGDVQLYQGIGLNSGHLEGETGMRFGFGRGWQYGRWSLSGSICYSSQGVGWMAGMSWPITLITAASAAVVVYAIGLAYTGGQVPDMSGWGGSYTTPTNVSAADYYNRYTSVPSYYSYPNYYYPSLTHYTPVVVPVASTSSSTAAQKFNLGVEYYNQGNHLMAVKYYTEAAEMGLAEAQNNLGFCYGKGEGVPQSYAEAVKWYRKAAEQGHGRAQYNLGVCYRNGKGVPQSNAEAVKWYRKAAEQGFADAQCNLGYCYEKGEGVLQSYAEAVKWYRKAAEQGLAGAQCNLGYCYEKGEGVPQSNAEAVKWYRKAAEQGNGRAQCNLGYCYEKGEGVPQSYTEAVKWYRKAAEQGYAPGMVFLALCYEDGKGVEQSTERAMELYKRVASQSEDSLSKEFAKAKLKQLVEK